MIQVRNNIRNDKIIIIFNKDIVLINGKDLFLQNLLIPLLNMLKILGQSLTYRFDEFKKFMLLE